MPSHVAIHGCLIGLLLISVGVSRGDAQSVELKSVELSALKDAEKDRFLAAHNTARKAMGIDPLAWSDELSGVALESLAEQQDQLIERAKEGWAEGRIVLPAHRVDGKYGENVAGWAGTRLPGAERAVTWWLTEKEAFDKLNADGSFRFGDEAGKTRIDAEGKERPIVVGHYTAIVWRSTTHLGAAKLTFQLADERGAVRTYMALVCNYDPAGNIDGERPF